MLNVGDVFAMPLPLGGFGACQIAGTGEDCFNVCPLDWHSEEPPTLAELADAPPLRPDHHSWTGGLGDVMVSRSDALPPGFVLLGALPVHPEMRKETNSYSTWETAALTVLYQRRWDLLIPADAKARYKSATGGEVVVGSGEGEVRLNARRSELTPRDARLVSFDDFPQLSRLRWEGDDDGLTASLVARPLIGDLVWADPPEEIDLSATNLTSVSLSGPRLRTLRPPPGLMDLRLVDTSPQVIVADGRWIQLTLERAEPAGLGGVRDVTLRLDGDLPTRWLGGLADLEQLSITWTGGRGRLADLSGFAMLHTLDLVDAYDLDAEALPPPEGPLRRLTVNGLRRSQVKAIKKRYAGSAVHLSLHGAKSDAWLAANRDNPLRDWVDDHDRAGAAACKAYAAAVRDLDRNPADARAALHTFVAALNAIDERYEIIDTIRREEAGEAFFGLAERAGVEQAMASGWFDEWRDF